MKGREQAYTYSLRVRNSLGITNEESHKAARSIFLGELIRQAAQAAGVGPLSDKLLAEISDGSDKKPLKAGVCFERRKAQEGATGIPFDFCSDPGLIGWCYQAWNQPIRDTNSWAISRRSEQMHESAQVSPLTQLFTDDYLANFIIERCLGLLDSAVLARGWTPTICDPACGVGHMLLAAVKRVSQVEGGCPVWLPGSVFGLDIDPSAVALARVLVFLQAMVCGYPGDPEKLFNSLRRTIIALPAPHGALERDSALLQGREYFDVVITNPPYLGRRKLSGSMREFLDSNYPAGSVDLCAAFMQRCIELCAAKGAIGIVSTDKWLRVGGYNHLRTGLGSFAGILGELSIDLVCELGARAFHPTSALHDGVRTAVLCARKESPSPAHTFHLWNLDRCLSYEKKVSVLTSKATQNTDVLRKSLVRQQAWAASGSASMLLQASDLPQSIRQSDKTVRDCADIVVGIQTNNDEHFVRFAWQVSPDEQGWQPHVKGGGYSRWCGLNRWVIQWEKGCLSFFKTECAHRKAQSWINRTGWCYSWFANGALGLRIKNAGWSFGRAAASAVFCEDARLVAFLNSRFASVASRAIGGKIQLPEGVVRSLPIPRSFDEISSELVSVAVDLKGELVRGDLLDVLFDPTIHRDLISELAIEAALLVVEALLECQVEGALQMSSSEVEQSGALYGRPAGSFAPTAPILSHPFWSFLPQDLWLTRSLLDGYVDILPTPALEQRSKVLELRQLTTAVASGNSSQTYALPSTGIVEQLSRMLRIHPFDVVCGCAEAIRDTLPLARELCVPKLCRDITSDILSLLGHRWWLQPKDRSSKDFISIDERMLCGIVEQYQTSPFFAGFIEKPYDGWLRRVYIPWQRRHFYGASPIYFSEDASSRLSCRHQWATENPGALLCSPTPY